MTNPLSTHPDERQRARGKSVEPGELLEVHLEELGQHSWLKALFNTLTGTYGSAQFRFVARPPGTDHPARDDLFVGATFPVMRLQDLNDRTEPNAWIETAVQRLQELDRTLVDAGWTREDHIGPHWWSLTYRRGPGAGSHVE